MGMQSFMKHVAAVAEAQRLSHFQQAAINQATRHANPSRNQPPSILGYIAADSDSLLRNVQVIVSPQLLSIVVLRNSAYRMHFYERTHYDTWGYCLREIWFYITLAEWLLTRAYRTMLEAVQG